MVETKNFPKAYVEVEEIIKELPKEDYEKIEKNFLNMINSKKDKYYSFKIDNSKNIEEQKILIETKIVLAYIYLNYLGTEKEKRIIKKQFKEDIIMDEKIKEEKYTTIFKEKKKQVNNINQEIIIYKKENIIRKFLKQILNLF